MKSRLRRGKLKKWQDKRGFGFIRPADGSRKVFLHISELKDAPRRPRVGDTIYYHAVAEKGKVRAYNARILESTSKPTLSSSIDKVTAKMRHVIIDAISKPAFPVLEALLLSVLPLGGAIHFAWKTTNPLPLMLYPAMSLITFALYADDKSRAQTGNWRTPEQTLHLCELAGGWLGGFMAQRKLRHKCRKPTYQRVFWGIVILHHLFWLGWLLVSEMVMGN